MNDETMDRIIDELVTEFDEGCDLIRDDVEFLPRMIQSFIMDASQDLSAIDFQASLVHAITKHIREAWGEGWHGFELSVLETNSGGVLLSKRPPY